MSKYNEASTQYCPIRIFPSKNDNKVTITNPANKLKAHIPECDGTDGGIFYSIDLLLKCTGQRGTLTTTGADGHEYLVSHAWRDAGKLVPGENNQIWMDILDDYGQRTRTNLFAAAGNLVTILSDQPHIGDAANEMWKTARFRRGFMQNKTAAQILNSTQFWIQHI